MRNPQRNRLGKLFELAPVIGIELPEEVVAARHKELRLEQSMAETQAALSSLPAAGDLMRMVYDAGGPTAEYERRVSEADAQRVVLEARQRDVPWALELAQDATIAAITSHADPIIEELLSPALEEIVAAVKKHAEPARRVPWHDHDLAMTLKDDEAREAYRAVKAEAERYTALLDAHQLLLFDPTDDAARLYGEMKNLRKVWPGEAQRLGPAVRAPWEGMTGPQRLNYLVNEAGAELWCPTADQIEELSRAAREASGLKHTRSAFGVSLGS